MTLSPKRWCRACCYAFHAGPCCVGWLHMEEPLEIQRCDDCRRFDTDEEARAAHALECGCGWGDYPDLDKGLDHVD